MAGLTRPVVDQISAPGSEGETEIVVENEKLSVKAPSESPISEIDYGNFDPVLGVLTLRLYNGEQIKVSGFPTADKIPPGPTGPQGQRGQDGKPGKNGRDGKPGAPGCEGPPGVRGGPGPQGADGRQGMQGPPGVRGVTGPMGEMGRTGPTGPIGPPGPTGPKGEPGPAGSAGQPGPAGSVNIIISATDPGQVGGGALWVNPNASTTIPPIIPPPVTDPGGNPIITDPPIGTPWP